ncbi:unnamed protein product, partial [marine sediment metagenome]
VTQHGIDDASVPKAFRLLDRSMDEERCDHYGRGYDGEERRWSEAATPEQLRVKDEAGMLADDAPPTARAPRTLARAEEALAVFRRFARDARHNALDARFWELAARERIFRVQLFDVMRRLYLARKGDGQDRSELDVPVRKALKDGDALYGRARELWRKILSPRTLDEELLTRWGEPRAYLSGE